jgi:hypothetical protein
MRCDTGLPMEHHLPPQRTIANTTISILTSAHGRHAEGTAQVTNHIFRPQMLAVLQVNPRQRLALQSLTLTALIMINTITTTNNGNSAVHHPHPLKTAIGTIRKSVLRHVLTIKSSLIRMPEGQMVRAGVAGAEHRNIVAIHREVQIYHSQSLILTLYFLLPIFHLRVRSLNMILLVLGVSIQRVV